MAEKKTKGKQKIEIKRIENDNDRTITFSKRKSGIYKQINELITTCNAEAAFLAFSGAGTAFTFGHPSMEVVANRLMNPNYQLPIDDDRLVAELYQQQHINELTSEYERLVEELEVEKERQKTLERSADELAELKNCWWKAPIEELNEEDTTKTHDSFVELHNNLCDLVAERMRITGESPSSSFDPYRIDDHENVPPKNGGHGNHQSGGA